MSSKYSILFVLGFLVAHISAIPLARALTKWPSGQIPYPFYQLPLQTNLASNAARVKGTPYEPFFRPDLFVYLEMIEPGRRPIDCNTQALKPDFSDINSLLKPASVQLPFENAWCAYKDGQGYVSSRTHWPGITGEQVQWWFWWHSAEGVRYSLWHPWAHIDVSSTYADKFNDPSLNSTEKLIGSVHHIKEIIGEPEQDIDIHWKRPGEFGLDESKFGEVGIRASACGTIHIPQGSPLKAVDMIHLWYDDGKGGLELRSRYFLANKVQVKIPILGKLLPIDTIANLLGIKKYIVGPNLSLLQFHHDQQEMTHLASILPEVYAAFANKA